MRGLGQTLQSLSAVSRAHLGASAPEPDGRLSALARFGSNPGALDALSFVPADLPAGAPLVVVLHGCTQNAALYDHGSGWSRLAERHGFAVLFAEQRRANNPNLCFNWYSPADARRGRGEALSIRQMVGHMVKHHSIDPARVFVTGLSAGGAMSMVMLATYPEVFAGGAVIAGLPFATANTLSQALEAMRGQSGEARHQLSALVARASDHRGPWPSLSVWHGTSDAIVDPVNAEAILDQWRDLHGVGSQAPSATIVDGYRREAWRNPAGREVIEHYAITGMGHGTPLDPRGESDCGTAGPHMLDVAICSTSRIAQFWGLLGKAGKRSAPRKAVRPAKRDGVGEIIENALRAAGLMP